MEDVTVGGGEGAPENNEDDGRRAGRLAVGIGIAIVVALVLWLLWPRFGVVPNVVGLDETGARAAIEKAGYQIGVVATRTIDTTEAGRVLVQVPPAGLRVSLGQEVDVTIAEPSGATGGEEPAAPPVTEVSDGKGGVVVPSVTGSLQDEASARLQVVGLSWSTDYQASGMPAGEVIHQSPSAGVTVDGGTIVKLTLSSGTGSRGSASVGWSGASVPDVLGMSASGARSRLSSAGYGMRAVYAPSTTTPAGRAFWQSAGPGPDKRATATIEVWISTGTPAAGAPYPKPRDQKPFSNR